MANLSELEIVFKGVVDDLLEAEAFMKDESCYILDVDETIMELEETGNIQDDGEVEYENILTVRGSAKWSLELETVASDICEKYNISAEGYDAERGEDFFTKFKISAEGTPSSETYDYICEKSIDEFGGDYFIEGYSGDFEKDIDGALKHMAHLETFHNFRPFNEEFVGCFCVLTGCSEKTEKELKDIKSFLEAAPELGEADTTKPVSVLHIGKDEIVVEATKTDEGYHLLCFNTKDNLWFEEKTKEIGLHTFKNLKVDDYCFDIAV